MKLTFMQRGRAAVRRLWQGPPGRALAYHGLFLLVPIAWAAAPPASAETPNEPPHFALDGGTVVTATGEVIEAGTVLLDHGLITAVGSGLEIPPTARVIDTTGLFVYPGLIDGSSSIGLSSSSGSGGSSGRGGGGRGASSGGGNNRPYSVGPEDRPGTTPWRLAAHRLDPESGAIESWREGGFTSVVITAGEGIFPGQGSMVNLAGEKAGDMVLVPSAALPIRFEGGGYRGFPGSLMGQIAYVQQLFLDADHYAIAWSNYQASPSGVQRPGYDRSLEPLVRAKAENRPVLIPGAWSKEIVRAIRLGEVLGVRTFVEGAHQGYAAIDELKAAGVSVLVGSDWPERSKDADPDEVDPLRVLRMRDRAPSTPKALHDAGIPFAFVSGEAKSASDMLGGVKKAIEAGLPEAAALDALTLGPATLYGVDDRLGSIEAGKIANLVVTDAELFGEKTTVRYVFVDGRLFSLPEKKEGEGESEGKKGKKRDPGNAAWVEAFGDAIDAHGHDHDHDHGPHEYDARQEGSK